MSALDKSGLDQVCTCETSPLIASDCTVAGHGPLERQRGRFSDFRRALLHHVSTQDAGTGTATWEGDRADDLGVMLVEGWSYLLDTLSFYDREIARNAYLSTTSRQSVAEALTDQIGYVPRPATASSARIAVQGVGDAPVDLPIGTAFRSTGGPEGDPQIFEISRVQRIDPRLNSLTFAPVSDRTVGDALWVDAGRQSLTVDQQIVISFPAPTHNTDAAQDYSMQAEAKKAKIAAQDVARDATEEARRGTSGSAPQLTLHHRRAYQGRVHVLCDIAALHPFKSTTGQRFLRVECVGGLPVGLEGQTYADVEIRAFAQSVLPTPFARASGADGLALDAVRAELKPGQLVGLERQDGRIGIDIVKSVALEDVALGTGTGAPTMPTTQVQFVVAKRGFDKAVRVHTQPVTVAYPTSPPRDHLLLADLVENHTLQDSETSLAEDAPLRTQAILKGAGAAHLRTELVLSQDRTARSLRARLDSTPPPQATYQTPVQAFANVVEVTRGETVRGEIIGQSDGHTAYQRFALQSAPLTYIQSGTGVIPVIDVWVNGILWDRVDSFLEARDGERTYRVVTDYEGRSEVEFGAQAIPASGATIVASYRFGAGAARPPAGGIQSIVDRPEGLEGVLWSTEAVGGSDRESRAEIKANAPASVLALGRAVSAADYAALAQRYDGVAAVQAGWSREAGLQRPAVKIWVVPNGPDITDGLRAALRKAGDPDVEVEVAQAVALDVALRLSVRVDPRHISDQVMQAVKAGLLDETSGQLSPRRLGIGRNLFRSEVVAWVMSVPGVAAVEALSLGQDAQGPGIVCPTGHYLRFPDPIVRTVS